MDNFVLFCKTYKNDLNRLKILKKSIDKFNVEQIPFFIICPLSDVELIRTAIITNNEKYNINFITDEEVLKINNINANIQQDWKSQQVIKLGFYKLKVCEFYAIIDSDCYFICDFRKKDFMYSDKEAYLHIKEDCRNLPAYTEIKNFFKRNGPNYDFITHGQVFSRKILESFECEILQPNNLNLKKIIDICPYEFNWYGEYYLSINNGKYIYKNAKTKVFWCHRSYLMARLLGETIEDYIEQGYILICLNNGWVKSTIFKPVFYHKFVKILNKFLDVLYSREQNNKLKTFIRLAREGE